MLTNTGSTVLTPIGVETLDHLLDGALDVSSEIPETVAMVSVAHRTVRL